MEKKIETKTVKTHCYTIPDEQFKDCDREKEDRVRRLRRLWASS